MVTMIAKSYGENVSQDVLIRSMIMKHFKNLPLGNVFINHSGNNAIDYNLYFSYCVDPRNNDENVNALKANLLEAFPQYTFTIEVKEVKKPELSASDRC
jgi:ribosomal protein S3